MATKYLQLFEDAVALAAPADLSNGQPWVGAEIATKKVRYEKTGVVGMDITTPDYGEIEQQ